MLSAAGTDADRAATLLAHENVCGMSEGQVLRMRSGSRGESQAVEQVGPQPIDLPLELD